ncbi:MAG: long-chain-fatty-acid--CoA ligase [Janthinobacterium lividum]
MDKIWLDSYPSGVPAEVDTTQVPSMVEILEKSFKEFAARDAFVCMGKTISYAEFDDLSRRLAAWLQAQGLRRGARVAIMLPNVLQYPVAMAAVLRAGYVVVNVNPLYTPRELQHQLADSGAEAIIVLENFAAVLQQVIAHTEVKHVVVASLGDLMGAKGVLVNVVVRRLKKIVPPWHLPGHVAFNTALRDGARHGFTPVGVLPDDIAFLQYTGGTTGLAKGAVLLHRNMVSNSLQLQAWYEPAQARLRAFPQPIMVIALPLYHIYALTACGFFSIILGGLGILIPNARDLKDLIKAISPYRVNIFPAVNTLYNALLNQPEFAQLDFSGLVTSSGGGMAIQESVARRWFALTKCPLVEGYGLSETSPVAICNPVDASEFSGTIGLPIPSTDVSIRDDVGVELPLGETGEICISGPQVMAGYWNQPEETAHAMTEDGFFRTGDIGMVDARGYFTIVDRKKDIIIVSGFNVYPNEVEDVAASHPGVFEAAAVGVPDAHSGEAVKLYIVKKDPALTAEDVLAFCRTRLTGYKRPRSVEFRTELPKTNVGKILRRALREHETSSAAAVAHAADGPPIA